jgi:hypothetical protein
MRKISIVSVSVLSVLAFGLFFAPSASAGCAWPDTDRGSVRPELPAVAMLNRVGAPGLMRVSDHDDQQAPTIVGFWRATFVSEGSTYIPDETVVDTAYVQWHSDGTEIMNSSRPPSTSSFCLGVWKKTGPFTYALSHFALSWNPDGTPLGPASISEQVTVDRDGDTYTGNFTITQYDVSGNNVLPPTPIVGVVTGKRITAN